MIFTCFIDEKDTTHTINGLYVYCVMLIMMSNQLFPSLLWTPPYGRAFPVNDPPNITAVCCTQNQLSHYATMPFINSAETGRLTR